MDTLLALLALVALLGGLFLIIVCIMFGIVRLLDFAKPGKSGSDWIWSPDEDNKKK